MLVALTNDKVVERWPLFREVLRNSVPVSKDMLPDWTTNCLYEALCGRIQLWLCFDPSSEAGKRDEFYCALVTKRLTDELSGQGALLIYALQVFNKASRECRHKDLQVLAANAKKMGLGRITSFCNQKVFNAIKKAFPEARATIYAEIPVEL